MTDAANRGGPAQVEIPLRAAARVAVERLALDRQNPRLAGREGGTTDVDIVARLYRGEDLGELLQSIAANGYLDIEPLIVLAGGDRLTVLEGNRRLAAIRLFRERGLAADVAERTRFRISVPEITGERRRTLDRVSVYRVAERGEAHSFIGFKHINGAAKWDSYAKAKFAAEWYRAGGAALPDIAARIGDRHDTVKRMVNAIYVLDQAEQEGVFHLADRASPRLNFSHFYTALSRAPYVRFLGLGSSWTRLDPQARPVPRERLGELREVLQWLYGSRENDIDPVVQSQNPHVKELGEALDSAEGLEALRATGSLSEAFASAGSAERKFRDALVKARSEIRIASNNLRGFDGRTDGLMGIAEDVSETAQSVVGRMREKANAELSDPE